MKLFNYCIRPKNVSLACDQAGPRLRDIWVSVAVNTYPSDIKPLTGLRFIAAFWLLLYFFWERLGLGSREHFAIIEKGGMGVDLFFILSGFILAHVYGPQVENKTFHWRSFLWARLARVYPLHLFCLAAMIGVWAVGLKLGAEIEAKAFDVSQIPAHIALVQAWGTVSSDGWNFPSWSISAEWFAYLTFPISFAIAALFKRAPIAGIALAMGIFWILVAYIHQIGMVLVDMTWQGGIVRIVPSFLMGVALWMAGRQFILSRRAASLGVATSVVWIFSTSGVGFPEELIWPGLAGLVFFLAETSKHENHAMCSSKAWVYLGEISFAAYMIHLPLDVVFYQIVERVMGEPKGLMAIGVGGFAILLTWIGAGFAHALIENPARNLMRKHMPRFMKPVQTSVSV
jgi:peptidoglycan/LPS O-acetylase OafA/YrhL